MCIMLAVVAGAEKRRFRSEKGTPPTANITPGRAPWLWILGWIWGPHPYPVAPGLSMGLGSPSMPHGSGLGMGLGSLSTPWGSIPNVLMCIKKPETTQILNSA